MKPVDRMRVKKLYLSYFYKDTFDGIIPGSRLAVMNIRIEIRIYSIMLTISGP